jgi:hypothetical protein
MDSMPVEPSVSAELGMPPSVRQRVRATLLDYALPSGIKRTRKRQIRRAQFMDHTGYAWSQWWERKPRERKGTTEQWNLVITCGPIM